MLAAALSTSDDVTVKHLYAADPEAWQSVAFGVIELDDDDNVRTYNQAESSLARRSISDTVGKNFFRDVAPCTDVDDFRGKLATLRDDEDEARFEFNFSFPWGARRVRIRAMRLGTSRYVFVTPIGGV